MGLAIIATLLMNTDSQILIVSYTNHALDQFLTGILRYTDSIVRIGNQSKNEHLDCFNIKQLCENGITDKRVKTSLFKLKVAYADAVQEFHNLQNTPADETTFEKYSRIQVGVPFEVVQKEITLVAHFHCSNLIGKTAIDFTHARRNETDR